MMDLNLDELESAPARKSGRGGLIMLVIGIALGVALSVRGSSLVQAAATKRQPATPVARSMAWTFVSLVVTFMFRCSM